MINIPKPVPPSVLKDEVWIAMELVANSIGDKQCTWLGKGLESRCNVDTVSVDVTIINNDVTGIYAHAHLEATFLVHNSVARAQLSLNFNAATYRIQSTAKLDKQSVAAGSDQSTTMLRNLGFDQAAETFGHHQVCGLLVGRHKPAIADYIR